MLLSSSISLHVNSRGILRRTLVDISILCQYSRCEGVKLEVLCAPTSSSNQCTIVMVGSKWCSLFDHKGIQEESVIIARRYDIRLLHNSSSEIELQSSEKRTKVGQGNKIAKVILDLVYQESTEAASLTCR